MTKMHLAPPAQKAPANNRWGRIAALVVVVSICAAVALMASVAVGIVLMN
jgi:hypothetical protein